MARKRILREAVSAARDAVANAQIPASLSSDAAAETPSGKDPKPKGLNINPLAQREGALSDIAKGRVRDVRLRMVDPKTCRMWDKHNRIYDLLSEQNCTDLINSIRAQGKQEIPAVVRRLKDDPEGFEYEVISGARRHFAVSHLREAENRKEIFYLIEIRDLEDEEAFRFADLENRGRQDISDYERGREYLFALDDYYGGNLTRMAERMEVSKSLLSSYLSIARLPREVLDAYGDPREIAVRHGQQLNPLLKGEARAGLLARAYEIAEAQRKAFDMGGTYLMSGAEVFKMLKGAVPKAPKPRKAAKPDTASPPTSLPEGTFVSARIEGGLLKIDVDLAKNPEPDEVAKAVKRAYEKMR